MRGAGSWVWFTMCLVLCQCHRDSWVVCFLYFESGGYWFRTFPTKLSKISKALNICQRAKDEQGPMTDLRLGNTLIRIPYCKSLSSSRHHSLVLPISFADMTWVTLAENASNQRRPLRLSIACSVAAASAIINWIWVRQNLSWYRTFTWCKWWPPLQFLFLQNSVPSRTIFMTKTSQCWKSLEGRNWSRNSWS